MALSVRQPAPRRHRNHALYALLERSVRASNHAVLAALAVVFAVNTYASDESTIRATSMTTSESATLTITVNAPYEQVLEQISDPLNHVAWDRDFFVGPARRGDHWNEARVSVPAVGGPARIRIETQRGCGALEVYLAAGEAPFGDPAHVRLERNGQGVDVLWTIRRSQGTPDELWQLTQSAMRRFLQKLKQGIEAVGSPK